MLSLSKIASELGVSKGTVSLVLNGKARESRISETQEKRIKNYCKAVNYTPNIHAQRLNSRLVNNIGILLDQYTGIGEKNPFDDYNTAQVVGGVAVAADASGYRFTVQMYYPGADEKKVFDWFRNKEIDGLIYYGLKMPELWVRVFLKEKRKVVGVSTAPIDGIGSVCINHFEMARLQAQALIERGRKKFLYVKGTVGSYAGAERFRGFKTAVDDAGIFFPDRDIFIADFQEEAAFNTVMNLEKERLHETDAIVCANDYMAFGVIRALQARQIDIPRQIAVAGADNVIRGQYSAPSLSTYDNVPAEQGKTAFYNLLKMLNHSQPEHAVLPSRLVWRDSTG